MATYNINCPHCGGTLEVQDEWAGMETTCPLCSTPLIIPRRENPVPPPPPPQQPAGGYSQAEQADPGAAVFSIDCPHCGGTLEVQDEWRGMETTCPLCAKPFVIPAQEISPPPPVRRATPPPPPPVNRATPPPRPPMQSQLPQHYATVPEEETHDSDDESVAGDSVENTGRKVLKKIGEIVLFILIAGGVFYWRTTSGDLSPEQVARDVKEKEMAKLFAGSNFIYSGGTVKEVKLEKDKNRERTYAGEVVFERNGRTFRRPIKVTYEKSGSGIRYSYGVDFDYSKHPEFMEEDADLFFSKLKEGLPECKSLNLVSAKRLSPGVVRCFVKDDSTGERAEIDIQVESKEDQFSYKVIKVRELK